MRTKIYSFLFTVAISVQANAQTGSVELKNGSGTFISSHASITEAYGAIPATLTQAYIIEAGNTYTGSAETYPIVFTEKTGASMANTITLRPASGATGTLIQASVPGGGLLILDGADYVIIDGREGGTGSTVSLNINNTGTTSSTNTVVLQNGATFNTVKYCDINNGTTGSAGRGVLLGVSASNPEGNSDNRFEYCNFLSGRYQFNSSGSTGILNTRNTIFGCNFHNMIFTGIWGQSNNGKMTIDSCSFSCNAATGSGLFFGILFDSQTDSVRITRNRMYDIQDGTTGTLRYIHLRSASSTGAYVDINNNFLSMMTGNTTITNLAGIEFSGSNPVSGRVTNNTIRMGNTLSSGGTSGNVGSSCLLLNLGSAPSSIDVRNNIMINERSGGTAGLQHVALAVVNTTPTITLDYNVYNASSGTLVRYATTVYNDIPSYQAAVPGEETNTNDTLVQLVSDNDLHLTGTSIGNPGLLGVSVPGINTDIDGDMRSMATPYRGADESTPLCTGTPVAGTVTADDSSLCAGDTVHLTYTGSATGLSMQWQSSADGTTYTDIPGAITDMYSAVVTVGIYYRMEVTCDFSGMSDASAGVEIVVSEAPSGGVISETHSGAVYDFSITGMSAGTYTYSWDFGDGNAASLTAPSHTYATGGVYTVTVIVSGECGADTISTTVNVVISGTGDIDAPGFMAVYPNPVTDNFTVNGPAGEPALVTITDMQGRVFYKGNILVIPAVFSARSLGLTRGVYLVELKTKQAAARMRLLVQ